MKQGNANRRKWFLHFLRLSLSRRRGRVAVASLSVTIATAIVVSALGLSIGIRQKLGGELKAYGANVIVSAKEGYLSDEIADALKSVPGIEGFSSQLYATVAIKKADVEIIGLELEKIKGWKIIGRWPSKGELLVGTTLRDALGIKTEETVRVSSVNGDFDRQVSGFVERGGPEDNSIILSLGAAREITGLEGKLSAVLLRAESRGLQKTVKSLQAMLPDASIKTLKQVAQAEESFLGKMELLMALVTIVVLVTAGISVSSTMLATVLERMKEIGLMKAIGGTKNNIRAFYLAESAIIGLGGGLTGYAVGALAAQAVSKGAFNSFINMPLFLILVSVTIGLFISVSSSMLPLAGALKNKPSVILRGE